MNYFESLKTNYRNDYLMEAPKKDKVLKNAVIINADKKTILNNSNNRALILETKDAVYLQSYDTLILKVDKNTRTIYKLWFDYSQTTIKHINEFMQAYTGAINTFNKSQWTQFESMQYQRRDYI